MILFRFVHQLFAVGLEQREHFLGEVLQRFYRLLPQQQALPVFSFLLFYLLRRNIDVRLGQVVLKGHVAVRRGVLLSFVGRHFVT